MTTTATAVVEAKQLPVAERVIDERTLYLLNSMLRDVVSRGTAVRARQLGRTDLAGKTGTTNGPKDAWFSGYNHHMITTVWMGFDQNLSLGRREYGSSAALPIWMDYMQVALEGVPNIPQEQPDGIVTVRIDPTTGQRAQPDDPNGIYEVFRAEDVPPLVEQNTDMEVPTHSEETLPEELF